MVQIVREMTAEEMNGHFNLAAQTYLQKIAENIQQAIDSTVLLLFITILINSKRVYGIGRGRSELVIRAFLMRLTQLGFICHFMGDATTPAITPEDCLIAATGSGRTPFTKDGVKAAKKIGVKIVVITSYPKSPIAKLADLVIKIKGRRTTRKIRGLIPDFAVRQLTGEDNIGAIAPMGTLFESSTWVFLDSAVSVLKLMTGQTEQKMLERHEK